MNQATLQLAALLDELQLPRAQVHARQPLLVLAAHPDDEAIGASWALRRGNGASVLFLTDGAPRDRALWPRGAPRTRSGYAVLRAIEARCALAAVGVPADRIASLHAADQEASLHLAELTLALLRILERSRPGVLVTHAYEGGHPDHDAAAFVAHAAVARLPPTQRPVLLEMCSYHRYRGALRTGRLLARGSPEAERVLSGSERAAKAAMFACYASQSAILALFDCERERYRRAPQYDFCAPPHGGTLHYETLGWPIDGRMWRRLADRAQTELRASCAGTDGRDRPG